MCFCSWLALLSQFESLDFAGLRLRQGIDDLDGSRILVGRDDSFHVILQPFHAGRIAIDTGLENDESGDDLTTLDVGRADEAKAILRREMLTLPAWAEGLPLQSEESVCPYYTKAKAAPK